MRISVIIPTFNCGRFIGEALESVFRQTHEACEVIVVDDGSTDATSETLRSFESRIVQLRQENFGVSAARNAGMAVASGDYVAFLDADDYWEPSKLERQLEMFAADPEIGLVHTGLRAFNSDDGATVGIKVDGLAGWIADDVLLWNDPSLVGPGGSIMVSREAIEACGDFDTRIRVGEDWDFCYRIARRYKVGFVAEPLLHYRLHASSAHRDVGNLERGMGLFYQKAFDTGDAQVLALKSRALAKYHSVLAGSYFEGGRYMKALRHLFLCVMKRPSGAGNLLTRACRRLVGSGGGSKQ